MEGARAEALPVSSILPINTLCSIADNRPHVTVTIHRQRHRALADTGAGISAVSSQFLASLEAATGARLARTPTDRSVITRLRDSK